MRRERIKVRRGTSSGRPPNRTGRTLVASVLLATMAAGCALGGGLADGERTSSQAAAIVCTPSTPPCTPVPPALPATTVLPSSPVGRAAGTFAVDDDGAATYAIQLRAPDGRAGM